MAGANAIAITLDKRIKDINQRELLVEILLNSIQYANRMADKREEQIKGMEKGMENEINQILPGIN